MYSDNNLLTWTWQIPTDVFSPKVSVPWKKVRKQPKCEYETEHVRVSQINTPKEKKKKQDLAIQLKFPLSCDSLLWTVEKLLSNCLHAELQSSPASLCQAASGPPLLPKQLDTSHHIVAALLPWQPSHLVFPITSDELHLIRKEGDPGTSVRHRVFCGNSFILSLRLTFQSIKVRNQLSGP